MKKKNSGILLILLSFFLPCLILYVANIILGIVPFGNHSYAICDGTAYIFGLPSMGRLLHGEGDFLYSLKSGLGANAWSGMAWGALSPVRLLSYFVTLENAPTLYTWICLINLALCGFTMYLLLAYLFGHKTEILIFSTSYALTGFNAAYCYHYLFFLGVQLLPLVILGLVKLIRGKSPLLYVLSLGFCIFINFYFGFILCVASICFFLAYLYAAWFELRSELKRILIYYGFSSLIAGLLGAPMWLPALKAFSGGGRLNQISEYKLNFLENMPFLQIFSKLFTGANSTAEQINGLPYIFCGILIVALVILYFINPAIPSRRKHAACAVLLFYLLTFYIYAFSRLMHGGAQNNWFNFRYSFVFSFFMIALAAEEFQYIDSLSTDEVKKCGIILLISSILIFSIKYEYISGSMALLDLTLLVLMWVVFRFHQLNNAVLSRPVFILILFVLVSGNLLLNYVITVEKMRPVDWEMDLPSYQQVTLLTGSSVDAIQTFDQSFYRMEKDDSETNSVGADAAKYGYYGVSHSGPTDRMFVHKGLNKLGINWFDMRHWYSGGVPAATDALLGLKYLLAYRDYQSEKGYIPLTGNGMQILYSNPNSLSVAVLADSAAGELTLGNNAFENLNEIWKLMTGENKDIFTIQDDVSFTMYNELREHKITSAELQMSISRSKNEEESLFEDKSYMEMTFIAEHDGTVYRFDSSIPESSSGSENPSIVCVGVFKKGDLVKDKRVFEGSYALGEDFRKYCAGLVYAYADQDILAEYAKKLNARNIDIELLHEHDIIGSFDAEKNEIILFTIPWDEGWTCYIDGESVPIKKTWDLFMAVDAPVGEHVYELKFYPALLNYGIYVCAAATAGLVMLLLIWTKRQPKYAGQIQEEERGNISEI